MNSIVLSGDTMPDLESLRCFLAAAKSLNFRTAARAVHLSPPAFGQRIAQLERDLGCSLFDRSTRRVALTSAGEGAVPAAQRLLAGVAELRQSVLEERGPTPFALTIASRFELGLSWLVPALSPLAKQRPERTLHVSFGDSAAMLTRTTRGLVDAAVTSARTLPGDLQFESLHDEDYAFVGCPSAAGKRWRISAKRARELVLIDIDPDLPLFDYFVRTQEGSSSWRFRGIEYLGTIAAIRMRVLEGVGVAVLPRYFVTADLRAGRLVELSPRGDLRQDAFRLIWRRDHPNQAQLVELAADLRAIPLR